MMHGHTNIEQTNWKYPLPTLVFYGVWDYADCMFRPIIGPIIMPDKRTCAVIVRVSEVYRPRSPSLNTCSSNQYDKRSCVKPNEDYKAETYSLDNP